MIFSPLSYFSHTLVLGQALDTEGACPALALVCRAPPSPGQEAEVDRDCDHRDYSSTYSSPVCALPFMHTYFPWFFLISRSTLGSGSPVLGREGEAVSVEEASLSSPALPEWILNTAVIYWLLPVKQVLHRSHRRCLKILPHYLHPWTRPRVFPPQTRGKLSNDLLGPGPEDRGRKTKSNHSISGLLRAK